MHASQGGFLRSFLSLSPSVSSGSSSEFVSDAAAVAYNVSTVSMISSSGLMISRSSSLTSLHPRDPQCIPGLSSMIFCKLSCVAGSSTLFCLRASLRGCRVLRLQSLAWGSPKCSTSSVLTPCHQRGSVPTRPSGSAAPTPSLFRTFVLVFGKH